MRNLRSLLPVTMKESVSDYDGPFSTFPEWHAALLGLGIAAVTVGLSGYDAGSSVVFGAAWAKAAYYATTGRRLTIPGYPGKLGMVKKYLAQIHDEPHYFFGGSAIGAAVAFAAVHLQGVV